MLTSQRTQLTLSRITALCTVLALLSIAPNAHAHGFGFGDGLISTLITAAVWFVIVLIAAFGSALTLDKVMHKRGSSLGVKGWTIVLFLLFMPIAVVLNMGIKYVGKQSDKQSAKVSNASTNQLQQAAGRLICQGDQSALATQLPQYASELSSEFILGAAQNCIIDEGKVEAFQALLGVEAKVRQWRTAQVPPQNYCGWLDTALKTKRKDFIASFHANQLPLHCDGVNFVGFKGTRVPWFSFLQELPPDQRVGWMEFFLNNGASTQVRDGYERKTLMDFVAYHHWVDVYKYLLSAGVKPNPGGPDLYGTAHWFAMSTADPPVCPPKPEVVELQNIIPPLTTQQINEVMQARTGPVRFYELLLNKDKNTRRGWGEPACERDQLIAILKLKPIIDAPLKFRIIGPSTSVDSTLFKAIDELTPAAAAYLCGMVDGPKQGTFRNPTPHLGGGTRVEYLRSRGLVVVE